MHEFKQLFQCIKHLWVKHILDPWAETKAPTVAVKVINSWKSPDTLVESLTTRKQTTNARLTAEYKQKLTTYKIKVWKCYNIWSILKCSQTSLITHDPNHDTYLRLHVADNSMRFIIRKMIIVLSTVQSDWGQV